MLNSRVKCCIVGRAFGFGWRHAKANVNIRSILIATPIWCKGDLSSESNKSLMNIYGVDFDHKEVDNSPGCFPIITSNATTPKR